MAPFGSSFTFVSKRRRGKKSQEVWGQRPVRALPPGANPQERGLQPARMPRRCGSERIRFSFPRDTFRNTELLTGNRSRPSVCHMCLESKDPECCGSQGGLRNRAEFWSKGKRRKIGVN